MLSIDVNSWNKYSPEEISLASSITTMLNRIELENGPEIEKGWFGYKGRPDSYSGKYVIRSQQQIINEQNEEKINKEEKKQKEEENKCLNNNTDQKSTLNQTLQTVNETLKKQTPIQWVDGQPQPITEGYTPTPNGTSPFNAGPGT